METELPLRDIHLPDPVGWWPPAPGWWAVCALLAVLACVSLGFWLRWRRGLPLRALALRELAAIEKNAEDAADRFRRLAILLRRVSLCLDAPRAAGASGPEWLDWLAENSGDPRFREGAGRLLLEAPYRRDVQTDPSELVALCRGWFQRLPRRVPTGAGAQ
jgi:hypothetical protein